MRPLAVLALAVVFGGCAKPPPTPPPPASPPPIECAPGRTARGDHCVAIDDDCRPGEKLEFGVGCVREGAARPDAEPRDVAAIPAFPPGLRVDELTVGTGPIAQPGATLVVHYTGTLQDGTKFDSSLDRATPFRFKLGGGMVIKGWEEGLVGMRVGGKRRLTLAPEMAYGDRGHPPAIPARAVLIFVIDLLEIK